MIRRQQPMNCLSVFGHFVGLELKGLRKIIVYSNWKYDNICIDL